MVLIGGLPSNDSHSQPCPDAGFSVSDHYPESVVDSSLFYPRIAFFHLHHKRLWQGICYAAHPRRCKKHSHSCHSLSDYLQHLNLGHCSSSSHVEIKSSSYQPLQRLDPHEHVFQYSILLSESISTRVPLKEHIYLRQWLETSYAMVDFNVESWIWFSIVVWIAFSRL